VSSRSRPAWHSRPLCPRKKENVRLRELIVAIHARSRGTYGVPRRIRAELGYDPGARAIVADRAISADRNTQTIVSTIPPSTLSAAPVVADAWGDTT
jgi:hypothetical protein